MEKQLNKRRVAVMATDGFEQSVIIPTKQRHHSGASSAT